MSGCLLPPNYFFIFQTLEHADLQDIVAIAFFLLLTALASILVILLKAIGRKHEEVFGIYKLWRGLLLTAFSVHIEWHGDLPEAPSILMGNHRSYLDVLMLPTNFPFVYVGKIEVRQWPFIGWGGRALETVWVDRSNAHSRNNVRVQVKERLTHNKAVCLFPESTTTAGPELLPFKPGMFKTAADNGFPITAIAMEYETSDMAWVGDSLFFPHLVRTLGKKEYKVKVGIRQTKIYHNATEAVEDTHQWIQEKVIAFRRDWDIA